jgi:HlyD family secretion protein
MTQDRSSKTSRRRLNAIGLLTLVLLIGGAGSWAATTEISGAVIASGEVVVESDIKIVQHPTGGVVGQIFVREGSVVDAGAVVMTLDGTMASAELAIVAGRLDEFYARRALLMAERDDRDSIQFPDSLLQRNDDPEVAELLFGSQAAFDLRRSVRLGQEGQLREQIIQLGQQIDGLQRQSHAKEVEIELVNGQLEPFRQLLTRGLIERSQVTALERDAARLEGEFGQLTASIAGARGRISELEVQILQLSQQARSQAASELQELGASIAEYEERYVAALDQLQRLEIRAPQAGVVHEMAVHTIGGVVGPGDPLMQIVPVDDNLIVEAQVLPTERDQLFVGQVASLSFSAFNQRATPRIEGHIADISPSTIVNPVTGTPHYAVRIELTADEIGRLGAVRVVPGMLVTAFIETEPRTFMQYLVAPIAEQIDRAFRGR